jgi:multisubunit Na+/H+ antiporter MnhB subunit
MRAIEVTIWRRLSRAALVLIIMLVFAGLALTLVNLPSGSIGLSAEVNAELGRTGVNNPVTATLLNFRSYDTLLEIAVLLLAVTAIRALRTGGPALMPPGGDVLTFLGRIQVPIMIMIAGYLLWSGADAPGGAFQAGAILAAAGVLLILAGRRPPLRDEGLPMRLGLAIGLAVFVAVGISGLTVANVFLGYSGQSATSVVLLLEVGASISIGLALLDMFLGVLQSRTGMLVAGREER